ncbi:MAG: heterodisulfide reductase-related iron-sulfur binding cluster [Defluviicoccus sp.]|nr:heterodisulfide reductase-related iron-sulfur binding cluster [Defluviicoccus sp.]MDE0275136.1 heterodisulfide reductase-related iron-sulfur binding cluster [Defluviicoccus sp.]
MTERIDTIPLEEYLDDQAEKLTDLCTQCGKCVEVCPVIREGSPMLAAAEPTRVIGDVLDVLRGEPPTDYAAAWAEICTGSGECIAHCPESINPRLMLSIALNRVRAHKLARGENPMGDFYGRMSQIIKFAVGMQMSPEQYRRITGREGNAEQADIVFYLGCNVLRTPVIVFTAMDILDHLGVRYAVLGGASNCCGVIHLKFHGDAEGAGKVNGNTVDKIASFDPETVLHWCPTCVVQFGETVEGFKPRPFEFQHFAHFLLDRLDEFKESFGTVDRRVALHRHDGGLGIDRSVETVLAAIPGLELVEFEEHEHWAYTCGPGALNNVVEMRRAAHEQSVRSALEAGADTLATLYHSCHRDLCVFEDRFPSGVHNWTEIIGEALGLPAHEDRYKRIKLHKEIAAAIEDSREFIEANELDAASLETMLTELTPGKEQGLSLW